ncbi:MAG: hypothetical protein WA210_09085 [Burkholderiaceae bacterium]
MVDPRAEIVALLDAPPLEDRSTTRPCLQCREPIKECMGSVIARDVSAAMAGEIPWTHVRELCPKCATRAVLLFDDAAPTVPWDQEDPTNAK